MRCSIASNVSVGSGSHGQVASAVSVRPEMWRFRLSSDVISAHQRTSPELTSTATRVASGGTSGAVQSGTSSVNLPPWRPVRSRARTMRPSQPVALNR
jgi:hypothetical protein